MSTNKILCEPTVRVGPMVNVSTLLTEFDCSPEYIFEKSGLTQNEFEDTEHRVPYFKCSQLLVNCVEATGCEHFGLLLGQMAGLSYLGVAGFLARSAETVGQALQVLVENLSLHDEGGSCALQTEDGYSRLTFHIHQPGVNAAALVYDMSAVIMCEIMRSLCGSPWNASQVMLVRRSPRVLTPYKRYFRSSILFASEGCGIVFPSRDLELKSPTADKLLFRHLELEVGVLHQMQHREIVELLPAVLRQGLLQRRFTASEIADAIGIHERTLHRRLKVAGTTFRKELNQARESLATQLLESSSLLIHDIGSALGYSDSSGFVRAFHNWTGTSPAKWRKRHRTS